MSYDTHEDKHREQPNLSSILLYRCFKKRQFVAEVGREDDPMMCISLFHTYTLDTDQGGLGYTAGPYPYPQPDYKYS